MWDKLPHVLVMLMFVVIAACLVFAYSITHPLVALP